MKRNIKDYTDRDDVAIRCQTQEEWDLITEMLDYKWSDGKWDFYKENSCISSFGNCYSSLSYANKLKREIIPALDFLQYTKSSLDDPNLPELVRRYLTTISVLCSKVPNADMIIKYITEEDSHIDLQEFLLNHSKIDWVMGINLLDAVDLIVENKE